MTRQIGLSVNGKAIELDYFVQSFVDHTVSGMLEALEGVGQVKTADISIDGEKVAVAVNGAEVPINPFVTKILQNTVIGMVSSLKGVSTVGKLSLNVKR